MQVFAGMVWGLDEDRILTVSIVTEYGSLQDELHIHIQDEKEAFSTLDSFLHSWGIKQLYLEELSGLDRVKRRVDGPLSIESSRWKRKVGACVRLQSRLPELSIKINRVNSSAENYTRCSVCGEPLIRKVCLKHHC